MESFRINKYLCMATYDPDELSLINIHSNGKFENCTVKKGPNLEIRPKNISPKAFSSKTLAHQANHYAETMEKKEKHFPLWNAFNSIWKFNLELFLFASPFLRILSTFQWAPTTTTLMATRTAVKPSLRLLLLIMKNLEVFQLKFFWHSSWLVVCSKQQTFLITCLSVSFHVRRPHRRRYSHLFAQSTGNFGAACDGRGGDGAARTLDDSSNAKSEKA